MVAGAYDLLGEIALVHPIIKAFRQQCRLLAIRPSNETLHHPFRLSKGIIASVRFSHRLDPKQTWAAHQIERESGASDIGCSAPYISVRHSHSIGPYR